MRPKMRRSAASSHAALALLIGLDDESQIIPFSAHTGRGRDELAAAIADLCAQPSWRAEP